MRFLTFLIAAMVSVQVLAQPTTAPTTAPAATTETLMQGDIVFTVPDGWKLQGKPATGVLAAYSHTNPPATLIVHVDKQQSVLPESAAGKIGPLRIQQARDNAAKNKFEFTLQPKIEKDPRFFLRIHQKYKKDGKPNDQVQIYRLLGLNLVSTATVVGTDDDEEAKKVFADAESILLSVRTSKGQPIAGSGAKTKPATRPTILQAAKISVRAPFGWNPQLTDNASGAVATFRDPSESFNAIIISVTPLPAEAKKDAKIRDAVIDQIVSDEKTSFKLDGAELVGDTETVKDTRFLRKQRIRYQTPDAKIQVTARQKLVGDSIVNVAMSANETSAVDIDKLADEIALTVKKN